MSSVRSLATSMNAPVGSMTKLRGHSPRVDSWPTGVSIPGVFVYREDRDAVMAAVGAVQEPARRRHVDVGRVVRAFRTRPAACETVCSFSRAPVEPSYEKAVTVESSSLIRVGVPTAGVKVEVTRPGAGGQ